MPLVVKRRPLQSVSIVTPAGDVVVVTLISDADARLSIAAPPTVAILRDELHDGRDAVAVAAELLAERRRAA